MKKRIFYELKSLIFFLIIFSSSFACGFIQIETGQLFHRMVDLELTNGKMPLIISRQYQQLKAGTSILGDRWCFDFEQQMRIENGGYRLYSCGNPTAVFFKMVGKKLIYENEKMFERKKGGLLRRTSQQVTLVYNADGYLIAKTRSGSKKPAIKFVYNKDKAIQKISYYDRNLLEFKLDKFGKATGIFSKGKPLVQYNIKNNKLLWEKNAWGIEHKFEYDQMGLLAQIKYPDNTTEKFAYSKETKTINDYTAKDGCVRKLDYKLDTVKATAKLVMKDSCIKQPPLQITLRRSNLFHKNRIEKEKKVNAKKKNKTLVVKRDQFNRINQIENSKINWTIRYSEKTGLMNSVTEKHKGLKTSKTYNVVYKHNKIVEISEPGRAKVSFIYSKKGQFLRAKSAATPEVRLQLMAKVDQIRALLEESTL